VHHSGRMDCRTIIEMKKQSKTVVLLCAIVVIIALAFWFRGQMAIDACLDDGGSWNYSTSQCSTEE
ncbi:hypothetical protein, partial [Stenotrophomonas maltophilia]|uniref:hypothetical protein n=1 Tax=Stenotrophomonas maltophilia TaxID=40324 RepID=UPI001A7EB8BE